MSRLSALLPTLLALLAGCASTSLPVEALRTAPPSRVMWTDEASEAAVITIARDAGFAGMAHWAHIKIDGQKAAQLDRGEVVSLRVPPGIHTIEVLAAGALNPDGNRPQSLDVQTVAGQTYVIRIGFSDSARMSVWRERRPD